MYTMRRAAEALDITDKTLVRWLRAAGLDDRVERDPVDKRLRYVPDAVLEELARTHHRALSTLPSTATATTSSSTSPTAPGGDSPVDRALVEQLREEVAALRARLAALERRQPAPRRSDVLPSPQPSETPLSASQGHNNGRRGPFGGTFGTRSAAGDFLHRHGIPKSTARNWWTGAAWPTEPRDALAEAIRRASDPSDWRQVWRLGFRRCDDPACVCREMMPE